MKQPMVTLRRDWPQVRQYEKKGHVYFAVDMRRKGYNGQKWKNLPDRKRALEYAAELAKKVSQHGLTSINKLNLDPRIAVWEAQFSLYGKTCDDAFNLALKIFAQEQKDKASPFMGELLTLWADDKKSDKLKPMRPRSLKALTATANIFKTDFDRTRMAELSRERIEKYLETKGTSNQYRENLRNYLGQFFNWAIKKGHWNSNPAKDIEIQVIRETPKFLTVEDSKRVMKIAVKHDMAAYFAICLFGGVRPEEAEKLTWKEVVMDTKEIEIPASISKTKKSRRWVVNDTLAVWLKSLDQNKPLLPSKWRKAKRAVLKEMGNWTNDVMRHTFCTYTYAMHHKLEELSYVMGNSPSVIETFYRGVIPQAEIEKWFAIAP